MTDFDSTHTFDGLADALRKQVTKAAIDIMADADFRRLPLNEQAALLTVGMLVGTVSVLLAIAPPDSHDAVMEMITDHLPTARAIAEGMRPLQ